MPTNKRNPNRSSSGSTGIVRRTPRDLQDVTSKSQSQTQPAAKEPSYFTSRKNILGMAAAGGVIALHFVAGLGFLWPVVAAVSYGGFALLTPVRPEKNQPQPEPQTPDGQAYELEKILYVQLGMVGNVAPLAVQNKFLDVYEALHWVLEHWDRFSDSWAARASVESIIKEHIPDVMDAYLQVIGRDNEARIEDINHTLEIFEKEAKRIRQAAEDDSVSALRERTLAVKLQYGVMPVVADPDGYDEQP